MRITRSVSQKSSTLILPARRFKLRLGDPFLRLSLGWGVGTVSGAISVFTSWAGHLVEQCSAIAEAELKNYHQGLRFLVCIPSKSC
jgi:hypothetical protein